MRQQGEESTAAESARRATGAAAERDRRFSARRKRATVLRPAGRGSRVGVAGIGDHGGAGLAMARPVPGRGSGGAEEPRAGCPG